jgi:hypothetical protein
VNYCNCLRLREIVKGVNKSNHPIQNPLLLVTKSLTCDSINMETTLISETMNVQALRNSKLQVRKLHYGPVTVAE